MGRSRTFIISSLIILVLGTQLFTALSQKEFWPFSPYRMYAKPMAAGFSLFEIFGITKEGKEIALMGDDYFSPFRKTRIHYALSKLSPEKYGDAAKQFFFLYKKNMGRHHGLNLAGLRIYKSDWYFDLPMTLLPAQQHLLAEFYETH